MGVHPVTKLTQQLGFRSGRSHRGWRCHSTGRGQERDKVARPDKEMAIVTTEIAQAMVAVEGVSKCPECLRIQRLDG